DALVLTKEGAALCKRAVEEDFKRIKERGAKTYGEKLYLKEGRGGIRQEAYEGFPLLTKVALPRLTEGLYAGLSWNDAGMRTLLYLIAEGKDTNLCARGGIKRAEEVSREIRKMLEKDPFPSREKVEELDQAFMEENLSPGGSADMLAAAWFLYAWEKEGEEKRE
ncbi:MAG: triphosphoribosyl-dephospho-CoA synthase, partial [Blautia sp.]|nr:triphosphoribosyl-dephospho-CoA synthase [Blautia sp.]